MKTGIINFCGEQAFNIISNDIKNKILNDIKDKSSGNVKVIKKHYTKFNKHHFKLLNELPHLVSLRSNGNPYLLYLTKYDYTNISIFIDKKIVPGYNHPRMIITHLNLDDELYNDTLIDGEMINPTSNSKWIFQINDIYLYKNKYLSNHSIDKRYKLLKYIIDKLYTFYEFNICKLQLKKYLLLTSSNVHYLVNNYINKLDFTCRGLYFTPLHLKCKLILYNFDNKVIKEVERIKYQKNDADTFLTNQNLDYYKNLNKTVIISDIPINYTTLDKKNNIQEFYIIKTDLPDVYNLLDINNKFVDIAYIKSLKISKYIRKLFDDQPFNPNLSAIKIKIKCQQVMHQNKYKWKPIIH
jgi:hypothetical protein